MNKLEELELRIEYLEEEQYWLRNILKEIVDYLEDEVGHPISRYYIKSVYFLRREEEEIMRMYIKSYEDKELPTITQLVKELNEINIDEKYQITERIKISEEMLISMLQRYSPRFSVAAKILEHNAITPWRHIEHFVKKKPSKS